MKAAQRKTNSFAVSVSLSRERHCRGGGQPRSASGTNTTQGKNQAMCSPHQSASGTAV